jgi:GT2 family glycosyltransferase
VKQLDGPIEVSAIIVNWNGRRWLVNLLDTLMPQLAEAHGEAIFVDNASTDDSVAFVEQHYPAVRIVQGDNRGYAAGANRGLALARGRYALIMNTDLIFPPGSIDTLLAAMRTNPRVGLAAPRLLTPEGGDAGTAAYGNDPSLRLLAGTLIGLNKRFPSLSLIATSSFSSGLVERIDWPIGACMIASSQAMHMVGPLDQRIFMYWEDTDWGRRFRDAGWEVAIIHDAWVTHVGGGSTQHAANMRPTRWFYASFDHYMHVHHGRRHAAVARNIIAATWAKSFVVTWLRGVMRTRSLSLLPDVAESLRYQRSVLSLLHAIGRGGRWRWLNPTPLARR